MIEKKMNEAIKKFTASNPLLGRINYAEMAFKAGIDWFLENLWHDANEVPETFKILLAETNESGIKFKELMFLSTVPWRARVVNEHITRWLYIKDLNITEDGK